MSKNGLLRHRRVDGHGITFIIHICGFHLNDSTVKRPTDEDNALAGHCLDVDISVLAFIAK
jgi:hypothetical protein